MDSIINFSVLNLIDVILPVYNGESTIHKCLQSVLSQRGNLINRIIVIDDGSSDNTVEIVNSFSNPIIYLVSTPNMGVSNARNLGLSFSSSPWVAFIDSDDSWHPNKLLYQFKAARNLNIEFVCCSVDERSFSKSFYFDSSILSRSNFIATSSVLLSKSLLNKFSPFFDSRLSFAEDYLAWLKCTSYTNGFFLNKKLCNYNLSFKPNYSFFVIILNLFSMFKLYYFFLYANNFNSKYIIASSVNLFSGIFISLCSISKRFFSYYLNRFFYEK